MRADPPKTKADNTLHTFQLIGFIVGIPMLLGFCAG